MMDEAEFGRLIREIVRQEIANVTMANVAANSSQTRITAKRFANDGEIQNVRNVQPFGVSSRPTPGMQSLLIPVGGHITNYSAVGQFDEGRPTGTDGETFLYDAYGHIVYLSQTKMQFGSKASDENMVLGKVFKKLVHDWLTADEAQTHVGNFGYPTSVPVNVADYTALKASPVDDLKVLSDKAFTEK